MAEVEYNLIKPWESLDPWQIAVIKAKGNVAVRSGRQSGKSTAISIKAGEYAVNNPKKEILVVAAVERQAYLLFSKIHNYLYENYKSMIKMGKDRPTKTQMKLKNGAIIRCLPTGVDGYGIRGYTVDLLIADEAAFIGEEVWAAITPMLAITKGKMILLSTPFGNSGYFAQCFKDDSFKTFHVSSEDCPRRNDEFLTKEKERMSQLQYAQEYLGEFVDELRQFFPNDLIKKCMRVDRPSAISKNAEYYLGVDIARMGADESTFEIIDRTNREYLVHVENIITKRTLLTETTRRILNLNKQYDFKQIFVDDGGMGVGVFDSLLENDDTKRKVVAINASHRPLDREEKKKARVLKSDIYNNLLSLMEKNKVSFLKDDEIFHSLASIQYEYDKNGKVKIFGKYAHIADGLVRAAWCAKDKSLKIFIY